MQNNDIEQAKYWIDYLKFSITLGMQLMRNALILLLTSGSAAVFIYSLIYSHYKLDLWANMLTVGLLILILISLGLFLLLRQKKPKMIGRYEEMSFKELGRALLRETIFPLAVWLLVLLLTFLVSREYLILIFLLFPLFHLIRFFLIFLYAYIGNVVTAKLLDDLLKGILTGGIKSVEIYNRITAIEIMSLMEKLNESHLITQRIYLRKMRNSQKE